jgi:aspartyl-tRNA(Asn)/glutamyl-tRNA(Gln) amidotransferase subunit A
VETDVGGGSAAEKIVADLTRLMRPANFLGLPVMAVPAGRSAGGLPIGVQLVGRPFGEETVAALGVAFQQASDHHRPMPALS